VLPSVGAFFVCSIADLVLLGNEVQRVFSGDPGKRSCSRPAWPRARVRNHGAAAPAVDATVEPGAAGAEARRELASQLQINRLVISQMEQA